MCNKVMRINVDEIFYEKQSTTNLTSIDDLTTLRSRDRFFLDDHLRGGGLDDGGRADGRRRYSRRRFGTVDNDFGKRWKRRTQITGKMY